MKYLMTFSYDGSNYNGYQKQPNATTIQEEIETSLTKINSNNDVTIHASGRTDAKVHALNQKAHFILNQEIDPNKLRNSLNKMINNDIYIKDIKIVDDKFHARYDVKEKEYMYKINLGEYNPLERNYIYQYNKDLNIENIEKAIKYFEGEHDFKSFTTNDNIQESYIRNIFNTKVELKNNILTITFIGNGFMKYMVRNMVGLLIKIGENQFKPESVKDILDKKDRTSASITANAEGLYLKDVRY